MEFERIMTFFLGVSLFLAGIYLGVLAYDSLKWAIDMKKKLRKINEGLKNK